MAAAAVLEKLGGTHLGTQGFVAHLETTGVAKATAVTIYANNYLGLDNVVLSHSASSTTGGIVPLTSSPVFSFDSSHVSINGPGTYRLSNATLDIMDGRYLGLGATTSITFTFDSPFVTKGLQLYFGANFGGSSQVFTDNPYIVTLTPATLNAVTGAAGDDVITGTVEDDEIIGLQGADLIDGMTGDDVIYGNWGDDTLYGSDGDDTLFGGQGNDLIFGVAGNDVLYGNMDRDTIFGGDGADTVFGGQGSDVIEGGAGDDWLAGNRDEDTLTGGTGSDVFAFGPGNGADVITDFNPAEGDRIWLPESLFNAGSYEASGADTLLTFGNGDTLLLKNVAASTLTVDWFIIA